MNLAKWFRRIQQAVYFQVPEMPLEIDIAQVKDMAPRVHRLRVEVGKIGLLSALMAMTTALIGAIWGTRYLFLLLGDNSGDAPFPLPLLFLIVPSAVLYANFLRTRHFYRWVSQKYQAIYIANLIENTGLVTEQKDDQFVVSWRADNHGEHILGVGQDETQAKVHASKTIMDLIGSLKPVRSLEYMRYTSEEEDPRKHLEKLFALHAAQKASQEEL